MTLKLKFMNKDKGKSMIIKCIGNTGEYIDEVTKKNGHFVTTKYSVKIEESYIVYGQYLYKDMLEYLILGTDEDLPSWYPAELFEIVDNATPIEWYFDFKGYDNGIVAIWGYKELALDSQHYTDLTERESEAIKIFLKRKEEIDEMKKYQT